MEIKLYLSYFFNYKLRISLKKKEKIVSCNCLLKWSDISTEETTIPPESGRNQLWKSFWLNSLSFGYSLSIHYYLGSRFESSIVVRLPYPVFGYSLPIFLIYISRQESNFNMFITPWFFCLLNFYVVVVIFICTETNLK